MKKNDTVDITLTRGEEEVMQILWRLEKACVGDIIAQMPEPKPKYTTVATFIKILENKGAVAHEVCGKSHRYYPLIAKEQYAGNIFGDLLRNYFGGSLSQVVSFFSEREKISADEMEEILGIMQKMRTK